MAFVPGPKASRARGGTGAFCPGWRYQPGQKVSLFVPVGGSTRDKRAQPFYPGWCYQPGQKASPRDSSKGSYSILSHVYYLGELARKPCVGQEVLGSNPVVSKKNFNVRHLFVPEALSRFQNRDKSQFGTGTKGQICSSAYMTILSEVMRNTMNLSIHSYTLKLLYYKSLVR